MTLILSIYDIILCNECFYFVKKISNILKYLHNIIVLGNNKRQPTAFS